MMDSHERCLTKTLTRPDLEVRIDKSVDAEFKSGVALDGGGNERFHIRLDVIGSTSEPVDYARLYRLQEEEYRGKKTSGPDTSQ